MSLKIFAEIGYGNDTFCSTEIEKKDLEHRIKGFVMPPKIKGVYLRFWIGKKVLVLSTKNGFSFGKKDRVKLKLLFGVEGEK